MNAKDDKRILVKCERTDTEYDVNEHLRCPYCFGKDVDVKSEDRSRFCDFDPDRDPINFGFPENSTRLNRG
jgi:hypothetical protein